jgi:drug/metabolite transporter (DMT)-like permease
MTLEAFSAVVLAAVFLDEGISAVQALGGAAIVAAAAVIAASSHEARPRRRPATLRPWTSKPQLGTPL